MLENAREKYNKQIETTKSVLITNTTCPLANKWQH